jgi:hypothetical protein
MIMISTKELRQKCKSFIEQGEFGTETPGFRMEYASQAVGMEIGYYSLSKADLRDTGCKRGRLIKKPGKDFSGYEYYFLGDQLQIVKEILGGREHRTIFLEYEENYCYGYDFFADPFNPGELKPYQCFAYEMDGDRITGFKIFGYLQEIIISSEVCVHEEKYIYNEGELCEIRVILTYFDVLSGIERPYRESVFDRFDGKYWIRSGDEAKDPAPFANGSKAVFDNQKKLCKKLEKKIRQDMSLDQMIQTFFDVVSEAKPNDQEMLLYEVGSFSFDGDPKTCSFCLVRQTPSPDDEFYQMHLELQYDFCDEMSSLSECEWHEKGDEDLQEYVKKSEAYNVLKDKTIKKISVWVDET